MSFIVYKKRECLYRFCVNYRYRKIPARGHSTTKDLDGDSVGFHIGVIPLTARIRCATYSLYTVADAKENIKYLTVLHILSGMTVTQ